ncbi:MAG: hypothetical protein NC517_05355 [Firmicutes bacterium]|nr:hypothetical protein [Bacillota bacterium]
MATENIVTENVKMREREISLLDLFVEVLLHWRMALVVMLLGGVLLGGFSYMRSSQAAGRQQQMAEEQQQLLAEQQSMSQQELLDQWEAQGEYLRERLDAAAVVKVQNAFVLRQCCEEQFDYQQSSLLMQLDPAKIQQADLTFAIRAEDADCAYGAGSAYEYLLTGEAFFQYTEERCGLEGSVRELISLNQPKASADQSADRNSVVVVDIPQSSVYVLSLQLRHDDADTCSAMADAAEEFIRQQQKELGQSLGSHEIILLSRSQGEVVDRREAERQNSYATSFYSLVNYHSNLLKDFSTEEQAYYDYLVAGSPMDSAEVESGGAVGSEAPESAAVKAGVSVKYVLLGMILFAGVYVFALFMKYIMNTRIRSTDDFCELYGIPQLGTVPAPSGKRFLDIVDQWILKLRYHNKRRFSPEESVSLAAVAVKMAAMKRGAEPVCLLGCELKGNTLEICEQIKEQLEAAGIGVNTLSNVLYDAEAMERLGSVGSVVLVETAGVTLYDEILKELELLSRQEITVLGGVIAE